MSSTADASRTLDRAIHVLELGAKTALRASADVSAADNAARAAAFWSSMCGSLAGCRRKAGIHPRGATRAHGGADGRQHATDLVAMAVPAAEPQERRRTSASIARWLLTTASDAACARATGAQRVC